MHVAARCFMQEAFGSKGKSFGGVTYLIYSRLYNYVLAVGNICHYRAIQVSKLLFSTVKTTIIKALSECSHFCALSDSHEVLWNCVDASEHAELDTDYCVSRFELD
jgi:hypothetical protein